MTTSLYADENSLETLSDDVGSLWCRPISVYEFPPDAFTFLRDCVHPNVPCIIKNAITTSTSCDGGGITASPLTLTLDNIVDYVGEDTFLTVDVTPDGHGDCIRSVSSSEPSAVANDNNHTKQRSHQHHQRMFVKPYEKRMEIGKFRDMLRRSQDHDGDMTTKINVSEVDVNGLGTCHMQLAVDEFSDTESEGLVFEEDNIKSPVLYYSRQNDCLRTEVSKLFATNIFPKTFPFAEEAFGTGPPDAVNLWIGNEKSVSSMHKDHYENLFYVCSGQKEFILCPPADVVYLHEDEFPSCTFHPKYDSKNREASWVVVADETNNNNSEGCNTVEAKTRWIEPDIKKYMEDESNNNNSTEFPMLPKSHPMKVLVSEGEMLFLPSLWYHRVTQTCETVGINYWYDMKFDSPHWCYFNFLQNLKHDKTKKEGT